MIEVLALIVRNVAPRKVEHLELHLAEDCLVEEHLETAVTTLIVTIVQI